MLLNYISGAIREIVHLDSSEIWRQEQKLFELGLRSRNLIELKVRLETAFSVDLPVTLFFAYSTLGSLTDYLLREALELSSSSQAQMEATSKPSNHESRILDDLEQLSDHQAEARLLKKIAELERRNRH
jgi:acyl carrier protein